VPNDPLDSDPGQVAFDAVSHLSLSRNPVGVAIQKEPREVSYHRIESSEVLIHHGGHLVEDDVDVRISQPSPSKGFDFMSPCGPKCHIEVHGLISFLGDFGRLIRLTYPRQPFRSAQPSEVTFADRGPPVHVPVLAA
jgi:hypothetical protein